MSNDLFELTRGRARPMQAVQDGIALALGRVHEACGGARRSFALWLAGAMEGAVIWIHPAWEAERLNPEGMLAFADPARFLFAAPSRGEDLLWCAEEVLRSGAVPLLVADLPAPPGLTAIRRMHLAAEEGGRIAGRAPLGLILTPGEGGAPGVETRWHMAGAHEGDARRWRLERRRARSAPPAAWEARQRRPRAGLDLAPCSGHSPP